MSIRYFAPHVSRVFSGYGLRITNYGFQIAIVALLLATTILAGEAPKEEGFVPLFDGKSLNGWAAHNEPGHGGGAKWEVRDGAIASIQEWPGAWAMLATKQTFGDFELRLEVKPERPVGSGVLVRATLQGHAYEVRVHCRPDGDVGGVAGARIGDFQAAAKEWAKVWKKDEWNDLRIIVRDSPPEIHTWLNGTDMVRFRDDTKRPRVGPTGHIGLEIHGDREAFGSRVLFRNLRVLELK